LRQVIDITIEQTAPDVSGVLATQGIPVGTPPPERVKALYDSAVEIFLELAAPVGIMADISISEFEEVYRGNGRNEPDTPLEHIFPRAGHLALFAFTLGEGVSREIERHFKGNGLALGYMLDAVASYCADKASGVGEEILFDRLISGGKSNESLRVLLYSPGYCGWHVSGQGKLFEYLKPEEIGITLNDSFLMVPLKSISGVLVAGDRDIHKFINNYLFCSLCRTKTCRTRQHAAAPVLYGPGGFPCCEHHFKS
jgi:hypothetical protein